MVKVNFVLNALNIKLKKEGRMKNVRRKSNQRF